MRWRHLLLLLIVPAWLILLWGCLMYLGYSWDFMQQGTGRPAWMLPGSVLLCCAFLLVNLAAFRRDPGATFVIALAAAMLGIVLLWKASSSSGGGELIYALSFFGVAFTLLYYSLRWTFDRDDSFAK